jgi:hypothetical protein
MDPRMQGLSSRAEAASHRGTSPAGGHTDHNDRYALAGGAASPVLPSPMGANTEPPGFSQGLPEGTPPGALDGFRAAQTIISAGMVKAALTPLIVKRSRLHAWGSSPTRVSAWAAAWA